ncbi:DUF3298 domain-containing protein [Luteimonas sp. A277]
MKTGCWPPHLAIALAMTLVLAGCGRDEAERAPAGAVVDVRDGRESAQAAELPASPPALEDVMERDPRYLVGISFPPEARRYRALAAELAAFADAARADLDEAVASLGEGRPTAPYDLVLDFSLLAETADVVAVAADGSSYTGGAHGNPLVARFVWLPRQERMLTARELMANASGWGTVSDYVREQLHAQMLQRMDAEVLEPDERRQMLGSSTRMIDEGSAPDPENFANFEPMLDARGGIQALRFVFPPYQVGPYSDGVQTVVVPAEVLLPHVAEPWQELFAHG